MSEANERDGKGLWWKDQEWTRKRAKVSWKCGCAGPKSLSVRKKCLIKEVNTVNDERASRRRAVGLALGEAVPREGRRLSGTRGVVRRINGSTYRLSRLFSYLSRREHSEHGMTEGACFCSSDKSANLRSSLLCTYGIFAMSEFAHTTFVYCVLLSLIRYVHYIH